MTVRFAVPRQDLAKALEKTSKALSQAPTESILRNFLIKTAANGIWVSASDKTVVASTFVWAQVADHGAMLLPSAWASELVKKAVGENFGIKLDEEDTAHIVCGNSRWNMKTRNAKSYPETGLGGNWVETHEMEAWTLLGAIQSVRKAMAVNLNGFAQVVVRNGKVQAADGVWFQQALIGKTSADFAIPRVVVDDVVSFLSYTQGKVLISLTPEGLVVFRNNYDSLSFRQPSQNSPDLTKAFIAPTLTNKDELTISPLALKAVIGRVAIASDAETQAITLSLSAATVNSVVVSAKSRDGSWAEEPIHCKWVGDTRKVVLHREYILNALSSFKSKEVTLSLGPDSPSNPSQVWIWAEAKDAVLNQLRHDLA